MPSLEDTAAVGSADVGTVTTTAALSQWPVTASLARTARASYVPRDVLTIAPADILRLQTFWEQR